MRVRHKEHGYEGTADHFNTHGLGEMIVYFEDDMSSDFIHDYLFQLKDGSWVEFNDPRIIPDNYNRYFREAENEIEIQQGYF